ncbi:MAG: ABC transporter permease [Flavobacteriales bacterium]|nr:ABC transporter permease [Flavobacteriales bacterium]
MIMLRILKESVFFAVHSLISNKLRTFLSLLGVTIGIFAIISVLAAVDSLETNVRGELAALGDDVIYVQKWPWDGGGAWWKYINRPEVTYKEFKKLSNDFPYAEAVAMSVHPPSQTIKFKNNSVSSVQVVPVSYSFQQFGLMNLSDGRYFSYSESNNGSGVAVLGSEINKGLFQDSDPIGKSIKVFGRKIRIIGVFEKEGTSLIGGSKDQEVYVPLNFIRKLYNLNEGKLRGEITVKAKEGVGVVQLRDELRGKMRAIRRLRPKDDDNFALNELSVLSNGLDEFFGVLNLAGILIGGFSILVGGFGIANIMFVSVRERTNIIGIQKSLGAKNYSILTQFLVESVILSLLGGIIGLAMVFVLTIIASEFAEMELFLGVRNIIVGVGISVSIGLIAGIVPAWMGAKMNPVDAIRTGY